MNNKSIPKKKKKTLPNPIYLNNNVRIFLSYLFSEHYSNSIINNHLLCYRLVRTISFDIHSKFINEKSKEKSRRNCSTHLIFG